jgi:MYXO-CTERM domain-containing protein
VRRALIVPALLGLVLLGLPARAQDPQRFSLSMFHFNVQYVPGGTTGFPSGDDPNPAFALDDEQVQDRIITESFEPVLDLFLAHSDWKVTLEMQGLMVEAMQARHQGVLRKLKQLYDLGQAEIVSFHYSDQLFLAYPPRDLAVSHELMEPIWQEVGIQPSPVVFCQEGQFGEGMIPFGRPHGRTIFVLPKNLFRYQHLTAYDTAPPLFTKDGADIVLGGRDVTHPQVEARWSFFDDGELLATNGRNPYLGTGFEHVPAAVTAYEAELQAQVAQGFRIATVQEYVTACKALGVAQPELPAMLDGTWQPPSTDSMHRWMGASGLLDAAYGDERDDEVLTGNVQARHWVRVAETLVTYAETEGIIEAGDYDQALHACWQSALLGQVSDASGINPFEGEVRYGLEHGQAATSCANAILMELGPQVGGPVLSIDTSLGEVNELGDLPTTLATPTDPFFTELDGFAVNAPGREVELTWEQVGLGEGLVRLTVHASAAAAGERLMRITFPLELQGFLITPGLIELQAEYHAFQEFEFQEGRVTLPLANGLLGLDQGVWLIKQTSSVHLGATFPVGEGQVFFEDQTLDPAGEVSWVFWLLQGEQTDAVALADALNLNPHAYVQTGTGDGRGCGCSAGAGAPGSVFALLLGLAGLVGLRRRLSS